jgi:outer membrane lipoprotein-sorting protein
MNDHERLTDLLQRARGSAQGLTTEQQEENLRRLIRAAMPPAEVSETLRQRVRALEGADPRLPAQSLLTRHFPTRIRWALAAGLALAGIVTPVLAPRWVAAQVLRRTEAAITDARSMHEVTWRVAPDGSRTKVDEEWREAGRWRVDSRQLGRIDVITNEKIWSYDPKLNTVTVGASKGPFGSNPSGFSLAARARDIARWGRQDRIRLVGVTVAHGRPAHEVVIERADEPGRELLVVDAATDLPVRRLRQHQVGPRWVTDLVTDYRYNERLEPSLFVPDFPTSARVIDKAGGRRIWSKGIAHLRAGDRTTAVRPVGVYHDRVSFVVYPSILEGVVALDKPITYSKTKIPLGELVRKVAADTDSDLSVARDVADEPVAVVVKGMPARQLLEQVAKLLDYQWTRQGHEGAWRYEIAQDLASKQREEALRQAQLVAVEKRLRKRLASYLELATMPAGKFQSVLEAAQERERELQKLSSEHRQALLASPEERARQQHFDDARRLWTPANRVIAQLIGRLGPQQWATLREEGWFNLCTDPQPGEARLPLDAEKAFRARQPGPLPSFRSGSAGDPGLMEEMRKGDEHARAQWAAASGYRVTIRLETNRFLTGGALWLTANAFPLQGGAPTGPYPTDSYDWRSVFLYAGPEDLPAHQEQAAEQTPERRARMEHDPVAGVRKPLQLTVKPRHKPFGPGTLPLRFRDLLPDLARAYDVQIISDAYGMSSPRVEEPLPAGKTGALYTFLDRLAGSSHRWERDGRLIRLRSRTWFFDRPREVPLRMVRHWKGIAVTQGPLPLDEYAAMATALTDAQLDSLDQVVDQADLPFGAVNGIAANFARHALRLYASLSPGQRRALLSGRVIPVGEMTPAQRALFLTGLREQVRRWYQPIPVDLAHLPDGSFALSSQALVRTILNNGGSVYLQPVERRAAEGGLSAGGHPQGMPVPQIPEAIGKPVNAAPARVDQVSFEFRFGPGLSKSVDLTVAPRP